MTLAENIEALTEAVSELAFRVDMQDDFAIEDHTLALHKHADALNRFCDVMQGEQKVIYSAPTAG